MDMFNQSTRTMYDDNEVKNSKILSQKPMKYIVDAKIADRQLMFVHPESVDVSSELREKPTNLNYYQRPETELFGTAPFRGLQRGIDNVDTESALIHSAPMRFDFCNRLVTEKTFDNFDYIKEEMKVDTQLRGSSTRSDMRNMLCADKK